ncbi:MAG: hypothetical protein H7Y86_17770 [Rhizobacter sp.]|nr:hypothetical protein [Ferruginibacter sp.]
MYTKFSDDGLIKAYESMKDYSGEANATLLEKIEKRGGMNLFLEKIATQKKKKEEIRAISGEIYALTKPGINIDFIKDHISSTILTP